MTSRSATPTHPFNDVLDVGYDFRVRTRMQSFPLMTTLALHRKMV
jgi:hypothetical protein